MPATGLSLDERVTDMSVWLDEEEEEDEVEVDEEEALVMVLVRVCTVAREGAATTMPSLLSPTYKRAFACWPCSEVLITASDAPATARIA